MTNSSMAMTKVVIIKIFKHKLMSARAYLPALVLPHALRRELVAAKRWARGYPAHSGALVLIVAVVCFGWNFMLEEKKRVEKLQLALSANIRVYEEKLGQKQQRLATALSHLEDNPKLKMPGEKQLLIGELAKLEWEYEPESLSKGQSAPKHSIVEIVSAEKPLLKSRKLLVAGTIAWYPIVSGEELERPGTFLWRVIPAEIDSSRHQRAESNWGPYSVFTIYPSVSDRIKATKKIIIGTYNIEQMELEGRASANHNFCEDSFARRSISDYAVLCSVINSRSIKDKFGEIKPVVERYSNIDKKLIPALKTGELDIAFGNISKAGYREKEGIKFLEYEKPEPILLTNSPARKSIKEIGLEEKIGTVRGTVYERMAKDSGGYKVEECNNAYEAVDKLKKNDIQWILMSRKAWEAIDKPNAHKLYPNEKSELLDRVRSEIQSDAFAITDRNMEVCNAIREALQEIQKDQRIQSIQCSSNSH